MGTGDKADLNIVCSLCSACKRGARTDKNLYAGNIIRNARLDETQAGIKLAVRNINNLRYADAAAAAAKLLQSCPTLCDPRQQPTRLLHPGILHATHWSGLPFPSPMHESEK